MGLASSSLSALVSVCGAPVESQYPAPCVGGISRPAGLSSDGCLGSNWGQSRYALCLHLLMFFLFVPKGNKGDVVACLQVCCCLLTALENSPRAAGRLQQDLTGKEIPRLLTSWHFDQSG